MVILCSFNRMGVWRSSLRRVVASCSNWRSWFENSIFPVFHISLNQRLPQNYKGEKND